MKLDRFLGVAAALVLALSLSSAALATTSDPSDNTDVTVVITAGTEFSVDITSLSSDFGTVPFALGDQACNWGCQAYYNYSITDLRGTGDGWSVHASATAFHGGTNDADVPNANLFRENQLVQNPTGFTSVDGSVVTGVSIGAQDAYDQIINASALIMSGTPGISGVYPNATGTFSAIETMWFTFPQSVAAGTYTSTLTLTLTSGNTP